MEIFVQASGWIGALLILIAYFLVSCRKVDASSREYQLMNLLGAIGVGINVFYQRAWPALALEVVWAAIAVFVLLKKSNTTL